MFCGDLTEVGAEGETVTEEDVGKGEMHGRKIGPRYQVFLFWKCEQLANMNLSDEI